MYDHCLEQLRRRGLRVTPLRQSLLAMLHNSIAPLSAPAIARELKREYRGLNKTTVYRNLVLLERLGLISRTVVNERTQYYELTERGHHHHFICTRCDAMEDIPLAETSVIRQAEQIGKKFGFTILSHTLEFYGQCSRCAAQYAL